MESADPVAAFGTAPRLNVSYVLPLAAGTPQTRALTGYLRRLSRVVDDIVVVDGSPDEVFSEHARAWSGSVRHVRPRIRTPNGKVGGVTTGVTEALHERVIVADDDVRYRRAEIERMLHLLDAHEIVRPQNWFRPLPWHARWDTARSLLNRLGDGDWPGTLGVRRSVLLEAGGYSGEVMFENLEMVRTVTAAGGREAVPLDLFVVRRPSTAQHFVSQRVRQAYDEWARPARFAAQLALLPLGALAVFTGYPGAVPVFAAGAIAAAEVGRRRQGGRTVFPGSSALWAPAWLAERAVTSWLALGTRLILGGVRYRTVRLTRAATPLRLLRQQARSKAAQNGLAPQEGAQSL
jgi:hypothetical protein